MNIRRVPQLRGCPLWRRPSVPWRRASKFLDTVQDGEVSDLIEFQAADVVSTATAAGRAVDVPGDLQHGEPQPPAAAVLRDLGTERFSEASTDASTCLRDSPRSLGPGPVG